MAKDREIEIQVQIEKSKKLLAFLKKNAKFVGEQRQIDRYFTPAHRDFTAVRPMLEWLRLRESSGKYFINYKNWKHKIFCDEYETSIEDVSQIEKIFRVLDMKPVVTVDKVRRIWLYKDYEIAMDTVAGLGDFVEVEYKGDGNLPAKKIVEDMYKLLSDLDCGRMKRGNGGYAFMLFAPNEIEYEVVH